MHLPLSIWLWILVHMVVFKPCVTIQGATVIVALYTSIILTMCDSCPPFRLSYQGLGEPLCFAAFGPLATTAFYFSSSNVNISRYLWDNPKHQLLQYNIIKDNMNSLEIQSNWFLLKYCNTSVERHCSLSSKQLQLHQSLLGWQLLWYSSAAIFIRYNSDLT